MITDLTGALYGCIRVVKRAPDNPARAGRHWHVRCEVCGAEHVMTTDKLAEHPDRKSCPACRGSRVLDRGHHPGFVDMTGAQRAGVTVLKRQPNARSGNAVWQVQCDTCKAIFDIEGIRLRHQKTACKACRPRRPGTVRRVREYRR